MPAAGGVVFDVSVLIQAIVSGHSEFAAWPTLPPSTENAAADCIGVVNHAREFALWLSPHILSNTVRVLAEYKFDDEFITEYADLLAEIAVESHGGTTEPPRTVHDCPDHEDNLIFDLASHVGALLIVSDDTDLTAMSPWRATPILRPREFAGRVDAARRARRA